MTLSLVAYSTPREVYEELIPLVPGRPGRARGSTSSSRTARRASRAAPSRPAFRPTTSRFSLEPDITRLVDAGLVAAGWNAGRVQGHGLRLGRRLRRPQGQPEGHQDVGRPGPRRHRGDHAQPVHVRRRPLEPHGGVRRPARAGQDRGRGARLPGRAPRQRRPCRTRARARRCRPSRRQGRRAARLRERGDHRAAEGRGARLRRPRPDDPDREPDRGRQDGRARPSTAQAFVDFVRSPEAQRSSARRATGRSTDVARRVRLPAAARSLHDRGPRRLGRGQRRVLRPRERARREDRAGPGSLHRVELSSEALALPVRSAARRDRAPAAGSGSASRRPT